MCGIAGFFWNQRSDHRRVSDFVSYALAHRGPDSHGRWEDANHGLTLLHRRLAILDLSRDGHQPMISSSGRYVITFNGEIYNFSDLKKTLSTVGHEFKGTSDTEVILALIEERGLPDCLEQLTGMFAFAVWDTEANQLWIARDRVGEKPLYYGWLDGRFCFASELKAFAGFSEDRQSIDPTALHYYVQYGRVPSPYAIYQGVYKLPPGSYLRLSVNDGHKKPDRFSPSPESIGHCPLRYWNPLQKSLDTSPDTLITDEETAIEETTRILQRSISLQMIADVPIGAFLSGGIDSSLIVALMQQQSSSPINTFTIGFEDHKFDEAPFAREIASHLGTHHTEFYLSADDLLQTVPRVPEIFDEPLADQSQIPTFLLAKLARQKVTVSLSGDGGDELFGGYDRHLAAHKLKTITRRLPLSLRRAIGATITNVSPELLSRIAAPLNGHLQMRHVGQKLHKLASVLGASSDLDLYSRASGHWGNPNELLRTKHAPAHSLLNIPFATWPENADITTTFMNLDLTHYLPDMVLSKLDRASMAVSLEARAPFLDHELIEHSFRLPLSLKIRERKGKWILRRILANHLPVSLLERPKSGFTMPIAAWLRSELRPWAEHLLAPNRIKSSEFFDAATVSQTWHEHLSGKRDHHNKLWNLLMFEAWREHNAL